MNSLQRIQPPVFPVQKVIMPEAGSFNLNNGIPVYMIDAGTEDIMRLEFTFKAGMIKENIPLVASTTNQMLSEGSIRYSSEELNKLFDFYGAFLNPYFEKDRAGVIVYFLNKHIEKVLGLMKELIFNPVFPENELNALMQKRLRWYLVNREKVQNMATEQFFESIFGKNHPYGHQVKEQDFEKVNTSQLKDFHSKFYSPDNAAIIVSGRIHPRIIDLLNNNFGDLSSKNIQPNEPNYKLEGTGQKEKHIIKKNALQTAVRIGSATINKRHIDYTGLKILNSILGGFFGSRLMKNIREEKGYTYGISSAISSFDFAGYKVISTEVAPKNLKNTIDEIFKEIKLLQEVPVSHEELSVVRNYMTGEMVRMFDGPFAIAESFKSVWEFGLDNSYYFRLSEKILNISPDEITELAVKYYKIDELYQVTAGLK
jgi:zinc protease